MARGRRTAPDRKIFQMLQKIFNYLLKTGDFCIIIEGKRAYFDKNPVAARP